MFSWLGLFTDPTGIKRQISALLNTIALLLTSDPRLAPYAPYLIQVADYFGIAGLTHAVAAKAAGSEETKLLNLSTLAALVSSLSALSHVIPQLAPYAPFLQKASLLIAPLATGSAAGKLKRKYGKKTKSTDDAINVQ